MCRIIIFRIWIDCPSKQFFIVSSTVLSPNSITCVMSWFGASVCAAFRYILPPMSVHATEHSLNWRTFFFCYSLHVLAAWLADNISTDDMQNMGSEWTYSEPAKLNDSYFFCLFLASSSVSIYNVISHMQHSPNSTNSCSVVCENFYSPLLFSLLVSNWNYLILMHSIISHSVLL